MMDYAQKMQKCSEYVEALEVERQKIQVFQRELPLCLELVSQAIDACSGGAAVAAGTSHECSEQTSTYGPVLEEFIPINRASVVSAVAGRRSGLSDEEEDESGGEKSGDKSGEKSDWLRSVQLWNQSPVPAPNSELKKDGGGFRPFNKEKLVKPVEMVLENKPASSTTTKSRKEESNNKKDNESGQTQRKEESKNNNENESGQSQRKQRRCWSPELHRRFIYALQELGGPHVATPKQIKELMKVDGLTNDEVKSHLQKYRLHMRRPSTTISSNGNAQGPQFVVVGGIWVPPPEYAAAAAPATASSGDHPEASNLKKEAKPPSNGVYAPVAKVGTTFTRPASKTQNNNHSESHCEDVRNHSAHERPRSHSSSPASSSSTHTTATATASPVSSKDS